MRELTYVARRTVEWRETPDPAGRMRAVLTWMIAVLGNQVAQAPVTGLDARLLDTVNVI